MNFTIMDIYEDFDLHPEKECYTLSLKDGIDELILDYTLSNGEEIQFATYLCGKDFYIFEIGSPKTRESKKFYIIKAVIRESLRLFFSNLAILEIAINKKSGEVECVSNIIKRYEEDWSEVFGNGLLEQMLFMHGKSKLVDNHKVNTMVDKKYGLIDEDHEHGLFRIIALKDFAGVEKGTLGGFIEKEDNLSQEGDCWIGKDCELHNDSRVEGNAKIYGHVSLYDNVLVKDNASIFSKLGLTLMGDCKIYDHASLDAEGSISGNVEIFERCIIEGEVQFFDNVKIHGDIYLYGYLYMGGDANVEYNKDVAIFKELWDRGRHLTWKRSNNHWNDDLGNSAPLDEFAELRYETKYKTDQKCVEVLRKYEELVKESIKTMDEHEID